MSVEVSIPVAPAEVKLPEPQKALTVPQRTAIEVTDRGILLRSFEDLQRFAKMVLEAGAAPKGINTVGMVATAIQMGMERGLSPLAGLRAVFFVNGLPSWRGEAAIALVRGSNVCRSYRAWVEGEGEARMGVCETLRRDDSAPVRTEFAVRDAKKANLWQKPGPWQEYPDRQLKWRAIGFNLRDNFSDVLGGFPLAEEAQDWPKEAQGSVAVIERTVPVPPAMPDPLLAQIVRAPVRSCAHDGVRAHLARSEPGTTVVCHECGEEIRRGEATAS